MVEAAESGLDFRRLLLASGEGKEVSCRNKKIGTKMKKMEEELAAVSLRLRVELDWVEERLSCQWASALDDYYRLAIFCFVLVSLQICQLFTIFYFIGEAKKALKKLG